jgi:hypothetical protein
MTLPMTQIEERLSMAYVQAVVARAGAVILTPDLDYGVDAYVFSLRRLSNGRVSQTGMGFPIQVKATTDSVLEPNHVVYDMDVGDYNNLALFQGMTHPVLVLFRMPKCQDEWLLHCEDELALRSCCYWKVVDSDPSDNKSKCRVRIPREQQFDSGAVQRLLDMVRLGVLANGCSG